MFKRLYNSQNFEFTICDYIGSLNLEDWCGKKVS